MTMDLEDFKEKITQFNNAVLCFLIFYIGISISSLLWKLKIKIDGEQEKIWKENEAMNDIEKMEKLY